MPPGHRRFLEHIESVANIRDYIQRFPKDDEITAIYNLAVSKLAAFRDIHIQIAARYIIGPSRKPLPALRECINLATASSNRSSMAGLSGTGGTDLMPFLKQSRDETKNTVLI